MTSTIHLQCTPKISLKKTDYTRHGSKIKSCLNGTDMLFYPLTPHFPGKKVRASVGQSCASGSEPKQRPCQGRRFAAVSKIQITAKMVKSSLYVKNIVKSYPHIMIILCIYLYIYIYMLCFVIFYTCTLSTKELQTHSPLVINICLATGRLTSPPWGLWGILGPWHRWGQEHLPLGQAFHGGLLFRMAHLVSSDVELKTNKNRTASTNYERMGYDHPQ